MKAGTVVSAIVERVEPFGVYLRHGDAEILVLVPELAWKPTPEPSKEFAPDDEVQVRILRYVPEEGRYLGSIRAASPKDNPYVELAEAPPGKRFSARVQGFFGDIVSVELTDPVVLGQVPRIRAPPGLQAGDAVEVVVSVVDTAARKAVLEIVNNPTVRPE